MFPSVEYLIPTQQIVHQCKFLPDVFMLSHKNLSIDRTLKRSFANFSSMENFPYTFAWLQPNNWHTREISENRSHMLKLSQQMHSLEEDVFILLCKIFCKLCLTIISTATVARTLNWTARPHIPFLSWHNRVNARKIVQTKTFTNEKVQKFKGVENFHAGYMDFMSGDLLHMYTGKFNGGKCKT